MDEKGNVSPFAKIEEEKKAISENKVEKIMNQENSDGYAVGLPEWNILPPHFSVRRGSKRG